jgi:hypothetical protein
MSGANIGGSTIDTTTIGGSSYLDDGIKLIYNNNTSSTRTLSALRTEVDALNKDYREFAQSSYIAELANNKVGGWEVWHQDTPMATVSYNAATGTYTIAVNTQTNLNPYFGLAHLTNGNITHFMGSDLPGGTGNGQYGFYKSSTTSIAPTKIDSTSTVN